jgi:gluconokinase
MPATMLDSQFGTLEPLAANEQGMTIDATLDPGTIVERAADHLTR